MEVGRWTVASSNKRGKMCVPSYLAGANDLSHIAWWRVEELRVEQGPSVANPSRLVVTSSSVAAHMAQAQGVHHSAAQAAVYRMPVEVWVLIFRLLDPVEILSIRKVRTRCIPPK